jgi:alanine racemase
MMVKRVPAGTPLGYGRSRVSTRPSLIGTLGAGYADGLHRLLSGTGHALVRGRAVPYSGTISMDHAMVDLTDLEDVPEGEEAVLLGSQLGAAISAWQFSRWCQTIPYEVLCGIGGRVPRVEVGGAEAAPL